MNTVGWFIGDRSLDRIDLLRAQLFVVFSFLIATNGLLFAALHWHHHVPGTPQAVIWVLCIAAAASVGLPFLLRLGLPMHVLRVLFMLVLQGGVVMAALWDGGLDSGAVFWLVAAPLASAFLGGPRLGWVAAGISIASGLVLYGISVTGHSLPTSLTAEKHAVHYLINFVFAAGFIGAVSALYEGPMVRHFKNLSGRLQTINDDLRHELTERQRAQAQAEAASRAKDVLLANMSHEFRTPLTAILGFTELLVDEAPPDHKPLLESIDRGGRRLLNTLNGVLDLAWIESNQTDIRMVPLDAQSVVCEIASRFLPTAVQQGLSFEVSGTETLVLADAEALRRVVAAIIDNAVRFTEQGSVQVSLHSDGAHAFILVSDTGIGMVPDFVEKAVEPFRQASEGDARTHEGVGVGLTVAERLLDMMGGRLLIDSYPGEGTTVTLQLPVFAPESRELSDVRLHELAA